LVWQNFDFDVFERASGFVVARWILQQRSSDGDGLRRKWSQQNAGVDKHLGYAVQWFSLAGLLAVLTLYFGSRSLLRRPTSAGAGQ
jgi:cytochrome oxidase assembly protein ShyY1